MLAPMLLSIESPHFFRAVGVLPLAFVPPALGLDYLARVAEQRGRPALGAAGIAITLAFSLGHTGLAYFGPAYRDSRLLYYAFAGQDQDLAVDINRFLGAGWQGTGWLAHDTPTQSGRLVWVDRQLWDDHDRQRTLRILVEPAREASPAFRLVQEAAIAPTIPVIDTQLVLVPGHEQPAVALLARNRLIRVKDGPLPSWQPPDVQPIYRLYTTESPDGLPNQPVACFGEGIELLAATAGDKGEQVEVDLVWRAAARPSFDFTVFVHVVVQETVVGQVDSYPAAGRYLTSWWRPGDALFDAYAVPIPADTDLTDAYVRVGLYRWDTVVNLPATDCAGTGLGEFAVVPVGRAP
jgi:hypothetical protein